MQAQFFRSVGSLFHSFIALNENEDCAKDVLNFGILHCHLEVDLVTLVDRSEVSWTNFSSGGGAVPCTILKTSLTSEYITKFSKFSMLYLASMLQW